ncbi:beta-1,3-N-acetylglucosaminyltransferase lunatic fringe-like [Ruditapes philippinarum]|uniref:beta-1,3-N-acetylglucosaminyltransferase lunatic fringe-like n=1 Tax=Ruditapes philippinarum TaxID=129788 RepID=UPI00295AB84B|nr:beta-1,3-N-acetylglucosaminyltransferase lunatic fringe-like [Ruditapes philippinarum]
MRVSCKRLAKVISLCLILTGTFCMLLNNINNYEEQNNEQEKHFRQMSQSVEKVLDVTNSYKLKDDVIVRLQRSAKGLTPVQGYVNKFQVAKLAVTSLEDIFISVKTTAKYHKSRLHLLLDTWISTAKKQTFIFTDADDAELKEKIEANHVINTNCSGDHNRKSLVCKMSQEFDWFINSRKRWFCHVDDDTYINIPRLVSLLQQYNHTDDWYLGKPSLSHPIEVMDRSHPGQNVAFWFATGGAGFCISRALALKMVPYAGGGRMKRAGDRIRLPDDCTIGFIINSILRKDLTVIKLFHSHLEGLRRIGVPQIKDQITFSYALKPGRENVVNIHGFDTQKDPTRFLSIHCHIHPLSQLCLPLNS